MVPAQGKHRAPVLGGNCSDPYDGASRPVIGVRLGVWRGFFPVGLSRVLYLPDRFSYLQQRLWVRGGGAGRVDVNEMRKE